MAHGYPYAFEEISPDLPRPPLAAVRALQSAGLHLSPRGWATLHPNARHALCTEGTQDVVNPTVVEGLIRGIPLNLMRMVERPADSSYPPPSLRTLGASGARIADCWSSLRGLDRYVFAALVLNSRLFERASAEVLGAFAVGAAPWRGLVGRADVALSAHALDWLGSPALLDGRALQLARAAGVRAARAAPDLFDLASAQTVGLIELDWLVDRGPPGAVRWQAHVSSWEGEFSHLGSLLAAASAAIALRDMLRVADPLASVDQATVREETWQAGSGMFADDPTGLRGM